MPRRPVQESPITDPADPVVTGGCQCGAVRYGLMVLPERVFVCHCRMCQKAVGGPFDAVVRVALNHFSWTRGAPASFASSSILHRYFCATCGTPLGSAYDDGDAISLAIGSLDRPQDFPPARQYGVESRLGWLDALNALTGETTEAAMPVERRGKLVSYQHPDHDTPPDWRPPR
jgi:hypothetical protein